VPGRPAFHDSAPAVPDPDATAALDAALSRLRVQGAIFLRGEYTESWAYQSMSARETADILAPGSERVVLFHVVSSGRCWIETDDSERRWADPGDVIVLPYGDPHRMGGSATADLVSMRSLLSPPPWLHMPVIRYGAGGDATDVVCGYLLSDDPLFDPRMRALPSVFVVSPPPGPARVWVRASIDYALHQTTQVAADRIEAPAELVQPLVREVLKLFLEGTQAVARGWMRGLHDPVVAPAMASIHREPERKWTVATLAAASHVSVSLLDERFRDVLGVPPIRYLTGWRMHVARDLLSGSTQSIATIARRVGYDSEEAFSRAFKRSHGRSPSTWRSEGTPDPVG
jgi:AraC-like DNA-binding protein